MAKGDALHELRDALAFLSRRYVPAQEMQTSAEEGSKNLTLDNMYTKDTDNPYSIYDDIRRGMSESDAADEDKVEQAVLDQWAAHIRDVSNLELSGGATSYPGIPGMYDVILVDNQVTTSAWHPNTDVLEQLGPSFPVGTGYPGGRAAFYQNFMPYREDDAPEGAVLIKGYTGEQYHSLVFNEANYEADMAEYADYQTRGFVTDSEADADRELQARNAELAPNSAYEYYKVPVGDTQWTLDRRAKEGTELFLGTVEDGGWVMDKYGTIDHRGQEHVTRMDRSRATLEPIRSLDDQIAKALADVTDFDVEDDPAMMRAQTLYDFKNQITKRQVDHTIAQDRLKAAIDIAQSPADYMTLLSLYTDVAERDGYRMSSGTRMAPLMPELQRAARKFFLDVPGITPDRPDKAPPPSRDRRGDYGDTETYVGVPATFKAVGDDDGDGDGDGDGDEKQVSVVATDEVKKEDDKVEGPVYAASDGPPEVFRYPASLVASTADPWEEDMGYDLEQPTGIIPRGDDTKAKLPPVGARREPRGDEWEYGTRGPTTLGRKQFHEGGLVPGPLGSPRTIEAQGGEVVLTPAMSEKLRRGDVGVFDDYRQMISDQEEEKRLRQQASLDRGLGREEEMQRLQRESNRGDISREMQIELLEQLAELEQEEEADLRRYNQERAQRRSGLFGPVYRPEDPLMFLKRPVTRTTTAIQEERGRRGARLPSGERLRGERYRPRSLQLIRQQSPMQRRLYQQALAQETGMPIEDLLQEERRMTAVGQPSPSRLGFRQSRMRRV